MEFVFSQQFKGLSYIALLCIYDDVLKYMKSVHTENYEKMLIAKKKQKKKNKKQKFGHLQSISGGHDDDTAAEHQKH